MSPRLSAAIVFLALSPGAWAWGDCEYRDARDLDLDAGGIAVLELAAAAGELEVTGDPAISTVQVRGKACASSEKRLEGIRLESSRDGDRIRVGVVMPDDEGGSGWFGNDYQSLDLEVRVPSRLALDLADSSGELAVRGVAAASIRDSSGDIRVESIAGDVELSDSSGDMHVEGVGGRVHVRQDSSGDIDIRDVALDVLVTNDSSGGIEIQDVRGDAVVENDSSGEIAFRDIDGSARVGTDSSGGISARRIGGDFEVGRDGSGGIDHADVAGEVRVPRD